MLDVEEWEARWRDCDVKSLIIQATKAKIADEKDSH